MPYCPHCQSANPEEAQYCRNCGYFLASTAAGGAASATATATAACPSCRAWVPAAAEYCPSCGNHIGGVAYGGFWIRLLAYIIDGVILAVINFVLAVVVGGGAALTALQIAVSPVYTVGFWVAQGATPGKMALGLRITTVDGEPIGLGRALLRYIGYILSAIILLIGYLMIAFTPKKRGLHDFIAGTVVVRTR